MSDTAVTEGSATRQLGLLTATLLVVASMIGTGVFTTTGFLVRDMGSAPAVLIAWVVGGVAALFGALAYAELVAALPHNGGEYQLLSHLYHPAVGFVSGFTSLVVGFAAPVAASALAFEQYLGRSLDMPVTGAAVGLIALATLLHSVRIRAGGRFQDITTAGKVGLIVLFIAAGVMVADGSPLRLPSSSAPPLGEALFSSAFAVGLIYISFAYTGWNAAAYVAGEVRDPARNLPRALILGTVTVMLLYLGLNWVFLAAAPPSLLSGKVEVGHFAAVQLFGENAGRLLSLLVAVGLVSTVGALTMTGPRIYEAMAIHYPSLRWLGHRRPGKGPVAAILLQSGLALVMALTATFDELLTFIGFTLSFFAALTVGGVFVLRSRGEGRSTYRTWGHPFSTCAFIALMVWMMGHAIAERPLVALVGVATLAVGAAAYFVLRPRR